MTDHEKPKGAAENEPAPTDPERARDELDEAELDATAGGFDLGLIGSGGTSIRRFDGERRLREGRFLRYDGRFLKK
ncbi:MAG TPA: hypothetical protein VMV46_00265 [Thermoanaerobaculia bacterium]|nr:hypothetical protein [Thermoanaerobaculia bacterium]